VNRVEVGTVATFFCILLAHSSKSADTAGTPRPKGEVASTPAVAGDIPANLINLNQQNRVPNRFLVFIKADPSSVPLKSATDSNPGKDAATDSTLRVLAGAMAEKYHGKPGQIYVAPGCLGFAIEMTEADAKALAKDSRVDRIYAQLTDYPPS
jgi:hypothetical protein